MTYCLSESDLGHKKKHLLSISPKRNLKNPSSKKLFKKLKQVGDFIKTMEAKKIQSEKLASGVENIMKTLEEDIKGIGTKSFSTLIDVSGSDRSRIEDVELGSKEKVIVKLIDALKKSLIVEDKHRRLKEHMYQRKFKDLFHEVRELKESLARSTTVKSLLNDNIEENSEIDDEDENDEDKDEEEIENYQKQPTQAPTVAGHKRRHKSHRTTPTRTGPTDLSPEASEITPLAADVMEMYKGDAVVAQSGIENPTKSVHQSVSQQMESPQTSIKKHENYLNKELAEKPSISTEGNVLNKKLPNEEQLQNPIGIQEGDHIIPKTKTFNNDKTTTEISDTTPQAILPEDSAVQLQLTNRIQSLDENSKKDEQKKEDKAVPSTQVGHPNTDVPFVRLKEEQQPQTQTQSNSTLGSKDATRTVANFKADDLKALEDNLFSAFESRLKNGSFNNTIDSLNAKASVDRSVKKENSLQFKSMDESQGAENNNPTFVIKQFHEPAEDAEHFTGKFFTPEERSAFIKENKDLLRIPPANNLVSREALWQYKKQNENPIYKLMNHNIAQQDIEFQPTTTRLSEDQSFNQNHQVYSYQPIARPSSLRQIQSINNYLNLSSAEQSSEENADKPSFVNSEHTIQSGTKKENLEHLKEDYEPTSKDTSTFKEESSSSKLLRVNKDNQLSPQPGANTVSHNPSLNLQTPNKPTALSLNNIRSPPDQPIRGFTRVNPSPDNQPEMSTEDATKHDVIDAETNNGQQKTADLQDTNEKLLVNGIANNLVSLQSTPSMTIFGNEEAEDQYLTRIRYEYRGVWKKVPL